MTKKERLIKELLDCNLTKNDLRLILINNFFDGEKIDISHLNLKNFKVNLSYLEAKEIDNQEQKAYYINNEEQKAHHIGNKRQEAESLIYNFGQMSKGRIDNSYHQAKTIRRVRQEGIIEENE